MNGNHRSVQRLIASSLLVSLLGLSACGKKDEEPAQQAPVDTSAASLTSAASTVQPASPVPVAYAPPSADQLYQMVAPIALFPDKLVALMLAGATYPDQITAANTWLAQNPSLKGRALVTSADQQSWDPSVKALTAFPAVLSQTATNIAWTTSLGQAYYNDPTDVLNAIQVMRQRAQASGNLCTTSEMRVTQAIRASAPTDYTPAPAAPYVYEGPAVVPPPPQTIVIASAQPDVVYVPTYNPAVVYGTPVAVYPGYIYHPPVYGPGAVVTGSLISFGVGVTVGALLGHVGWGWHAWGMHWGGPPAGGPGGPGRGGWQRPAVVYNHTTYISRSTTVINRINPINNAHIANSYSGAVTNGFVRNGNGNGNGTPQAAIAQMHAPQPGFGMRSSAPMTMPRFSANDARPGARPSPQFGPNHANAMAMNRAQTSALHGNLVTAHTPSESQGYLKGSSQIEHQQVSHFTPHSTPQYAGQFRSERSAEAPVHLQEAEAMPHRENAELHAQAVPHGGVAQAHPTGLRQNEQHFAQPQSQPPRAQPHLLSPRPHQAAPRPAAYHAESHEHHP